MKRVTALGVCLIVAAGLYWIAQAGDLEPPGAPAPTMKTLTDVEPRTAITSVPYTIASSGSYYLAGDFASSGTAITIQADDVTLDLRGHTLSGAGGTHGIHMSGRQNVEIRNGTVKGFNDKGIYEEIGDGHRVINVRALNNGGAGIMLMGHDHLVQDCTAAHSGHAGIYVRGSATITHCKVHNNSYAGIYSETSALIEKCSAYNNTNRGIRAGRGSVILGNTAFHNTNSEGILCEEGCTVAHNAAHDNHVGIKTGTGSSAIGNTAYDNTYYGLDIGHANMIDQNTAWNNGTNARYGSECVDGVNVD